MTIGTGRRRLTPAQRREVWRRWRAGTSLAFALPASKGEWTLVHRVCFERAFAAGYRELGAAR